MSEANETAPSDRFIDHELINAAMQRAVRETVLTHARLGHPGLRA